MNDLKTTGEKIRMLRVKNGYTQQQVSIMMGVNVRTYRRWENDETSMGLAEFVRLMSLYGYTIDIVNISDAYKKR